MNNNRNVRIAYTNKQVTFTQRGKNKKNGFIRMNGRTISGEATPSYWNNNETLFYPSGVNSEVPYGGDSGSW